MKEYSNFGTSTIFQEKNQQEVFPVVLESIAEGLEDQVTQVVLSAISFFEIILEKTENDPQQKDNIQFATEKIMNA